MDSIINYLLTTPYAQYFMAFCLLCRIFTSLAPVSLTEKVPDVVMIWINAFALASNKTVDNKGNPKL